MGRAIDILIAEDDENDRLLVSRAFARSPRKYELAFVRDGQEAIEAMQNPGGGLVPSLLLLDLKMPRVDGFQVLQWLHEHPTYRPGRVVVLSSSVDPRDSVRSRALGVDLHLSKPHDSRDYVHVATSILQEMVSRSALPEGCPPSLFPLPPGEGTESPARVSVGSGPAKE